MLFIAGAYADEYSPAYLEFQQIDEEVIDMLWKVPTKGSDQPLGLNVRLPDDLITIKPPQVSFVAGAMIERSTLSRPGGMAGVRIRIDGLSTASTDVLVRIHRLDGSTQVTRLNPASPSFLVVASPKTWDVAKTYLWFGIEHIWQGVDHLLFVACLILISGTWRRILLTVTGFTIAHSITLALVALEWVRAPVPPVEATIALSIVFLAREIAHERRDTLTWRYPVLVSAVFGLLHGFGFASALLDIGLPQMEIPAALLAFNLGVEVGQIVFVAALLAVMWAAAKGLGRLAAQPKEWLGQLEKPIAYAVGGITSYWTFERVLVFC